VINAVSQNAEYTVLIGQNFKDAEIRCRNEGAAQFIILKNFMESALNNFNQYDLVQNTVSSLKISNNEKNDLVKNIMASIQV
jgi:predicted XRE-type DNA-binding protein